MVGEVSRFEENGLLRSHGKPCYRLWYPRVHDVVGLIVNGASGDDVCRSFPDLKRSQVYECLAYYEDHRGEIDALVAEQMAEDLK